MLKKSAKGKKSGDAKKPEKVKSASSNTKADDNLKAEHASALPLFFKKPQALDKERHAKAGIRPAQHYGYAKATNSIPLNAIEFIEVVKHFPIVFTAEDMPTPVAVVGLKQGNYCVDENGAWDKRRYIPAYVRQYPFVFFEQKEEEKFYLCVDQASDSFVEKATSKDQALFDDKGEPTPATQNALDFCTAYYNHRQITENFCKDLKKHELLMPYHSEATLASGEKINLSGFQMIDEQRFNKLPDEVVLEFKQKGWLAFIYLSLAAASNWKQLFDYANEADAKVVKSKIQAV